MTPKAFFVPAARSPRLAGGQRVCHKRREIVVHKAAFVPLCAGGCPQVILERGERTRPTRDEDGRDQGSAGVRQRG